MAVVIDASIAAMWFLPDEMDVSAEKTLDSLNDQTAKVPSLFWFQIRNILVKAARRKRLQGPDIGHAIKLLRQLPIDDAGTGDDELILALCARHGLSAYDSSYLALALQVEGPIATADTALAAAALRENVKVLR